MKLGNNARLLITGDSVTDAGRVRPVAQGTLFDPLGTGYPRVVGGLINAVYPERNINVINTGVSGDTARRLAARWQSDVLDLKPDWVSVMIGVNDVWRQFDSPTQPEEHVGPEEYEATLDELFTLTKPRLSGNLIVMTPFYVETNLADAMRAMIGRYADICRALARKHGAVLVDTQSCMEKILESHHSSYLTWDRVHPNNVGHTALARAFLKALDFEF